MSLLPGKEETVPRHQANQLQHIFHLQAAAGEWAKIEETNQLARQHAGREASGTRLLAEMDRYTVGWKSLCLGMVGVA